MSDSQNNSDQPPPTDQQDQPPADQPNSTPDITQPRKWIAGPHGTEINPAWQAQAGLPSGRDARDAHISAMNPVSKPPDLPGAQEGAARELMNHFLRLEHRISELEAHSRPPRPSYPPGLRSSFPALITSAYNSGDVHRFGFAAQQLDPTGNLVSVMPVVVDDAGSDLAAAPLNDTLPEIGDFVSMWAFDNSNQITYAFLACPTASSIASSITSGLVANSALSVPIRVVTSVQINSAAGNLTLNYNWVSAQVVNIQASGFVSVVPIKQC